MKLIPIFDLALESTKHPAKVLWDLLDQRSPENNISHRQMPSWDEHVAFVQGHPYEAWYLIVDVIRDRRAPAYSPEVIGAIYLSKPGSPSVPGNEIGIDIFKEYQGKGYGTQAVKLLMEMHGERRYIANTSPTNEASQALFKSLGFKLVQHTFALEAE